ncbi:MAG: carbohydrate ABC transporter permease, partial [Clostridia bacterium]
MTKRFNSLRKQKGDVAVSAINMLALIVLMLFFIYPFYNCVVLSFNDGQDAMKSGLYFWPRVFTLDNYAEALASDGFVRAAVVSFVRTAIGTVFSVLVCAMYAYAVSKPNLKFRRGYLMFGTLTMFFSGGMIPTFLLIKELGLYNNFWVYILPMLFSMFYSIIFMGAFRELPAALEESAMLDGANYFTIFYRIILPISMPTVAAIAIFTAVGHWNSWMDTMLYTDKKTWNTLSFLFSRSVFQMQYAEELVKTSSGEAAKIAQGIGGASYNSVIVATMVLATIPIMLIYPFFQKHFAKGVMIGSIK